MLSLPDFGLAEGFVIVDDEAGEMVGDWDAGKNEVRGAEDSTGWSIGRILFAGEVSGMNVELVGMQALVDVAENEIGCVVTASSIPPALNNASVVPPDSVVLSLVIQGLIVRDGFDQEVKSNGFGPPNVSFTTTLPTWEESVCSPVSMDEYSNPVAGAGV
jgi:predicted Fe-Mo cluster-binding NifX family protein